MRLARKFRLPKPVSAPVMLKLAAIVHYRAMSHEDPRHNFVLTDKECRAIGNEYGVEPWVIRRLRDAAPISSVRFLNGRGHSTTPFKWERP